MHSVMVWSVAAERLAGDHELASTPVCGPQSAGVAFATALRTRARCSRATWPLPKRVDRSGRVERDIGSTLIASQATQWFKRRRVLEVIMKAKYPRSRSSRLALVLHPPGRGSKSR